MDARGMIAVYHWNTPQRAQSDQKQRASLPLGTAHMTLPRLVDA
jgi:hypothetical protein